MYQERASVVAHSVVWRRRAAGELRIVPDGCMDLIWTGGTLLVAGPDTRAHIASGTAGAVVTGLRFAPGTAAAVLGVPASALRDQRVALQDLWAADRVGRLAERVAATAAPGRALEAVAEDRLRGGHAPAPVLRAIVALLRAGQPVAAVADAVGLSERQLHRRSLAAFGYGPKTLARVLRFDRALALAQDGVPLAETAALAGYADQPHLAREVKALSGVPLGRLRG